MALMEPPPFQFEAEREVLPTYSEANGGQGSATNSPTIPSTPRELTAHCYQLKDKPGHAWLVLKCSSRARTPDQLPRIAEGDKLAGTVEMDLTDSISAKQVKITLTGELVGRSNIRYPFLTLSQDLWTEEGASSPTSSLRLTKGKLRGSFSWPFVIELPPTVTFEMDGVQTDYKLPGTFIGRHVACTVLYTLTVAVVHGKFTPDHTVGTTVAYVPVITPDPPSFARQLAYQEHSPLLGVIGDPDGWHSLPLVSIPGTIFGVRAVEVNVTLSLAKPLCYTRGSVIPLILTVSCVDPQALDVVSPAGIFPVRLRRTLIFGQSNIDAAVYERKKMPVGGTRSAKATMAETFKPEWLGTANWWRSPYGDDRPDENTRTLQGEIHLPTNLAPAGQLPRYKLAYEVVLEMPNAVAFVPNSRSTDVLETVSVEIATVHGPGPRPLVYTPPKYSANADEDTRTSTGAREQSRISASQAFM